MQCFLIVAFILLALFGLTELIHRFLIFLIRPKEYEDYLLVLLYGSMASDSLKTAIYKFNSDGGRAYKKIIAVDCGIDPDFLSHITKVAHSNENIIFSSLDNLNISIKKLKENSVG